MLARFRGVITYAAEHLHAHPIKQFRVSVNRGTQAWVQVLTVERPLVQPRLVIHPSSAVVSVIELHTDEVAEVADGPVDAVAKSGNLEVGGNNTQPPYVHRHRVRVVQEPRIRAELEHVCGDGGEQRERPQRAEDAANTGRVTDRLTESVLGRDFEVGAGGVDTADLHHVDDEVCSGERFAAIEGGHHGDRTGKLRRELRGRFGSNAQAFCVNVVQHESELRKVVEAQEVRNELAGKYDASGTDKDNVGHGSIFTYTE